MQFNDMVYLRPNYEYIKATLIEYIYELNETNSLNSVIINFTKYLDIKEDYYLAEVLIKLRVDLDDSRDYYKNELAILNKYNEVINSLMFEYQVAILKKPCIDALKSLYGKQYFKYVDNNAQLNTLANVMLKRNDKILIEEYNKLYTDTEFTIFDKKYSIIDLIPLLNSNNYLIKKQALSKYNIFYNDKKEDLTRIFRDLVISRNRQAYNLGYDTYTRFSYIKMNRLDYSEKDIITLRLSVVKHIVPLIDKIIDKYPLRNDEVMSTSNVENNLNYSTSKNKLKLEESLKKIFTNINEETESFIKFMLNNNLIELRSKKDIITKAYTRFIPKYKSPFIITNFNNREFDIELFMHEAGHAFNIYMNRNNELIDLVKPNLNLDLDSVGMEILTYPFLSELLGDESNAYCLNNLIKKVKHIPYGVMMDHFQHLVYDDICQINYDEIYDKLTRIYMPEIKVTDELLIKDRFYFEDVNIFRKPFIDIDYVLSIIVSLQLFIVMKDDYNKAWTIYLDIINNIGNLSFNELLNKVGLKSIFEETTIEGLAFDLEQYFANHELVS